MRQCPKCHGDGTIEVAGESVSPFSGVRVIDPQETVTDKCWRCRGTGAVA